MLQNTQDTQFLPQTKKNCFYPIVINARTHLLLVLGEETLKESKLWHNLHYIHFCNKCIWGRPIQFYQYVYLDQTLNSALATIQYYFCQKAGYCLLLFEIKGKCNNNDVIIVPRNNAVGFLTVCATYLNVWLNAFMLV